LPSPDSQVDLLKIIQLGVTFADESGELADDCPTWQFNFKFNLQEDMYAQDSIDLLTRSGIEFKQHEERGIDVDYFGEVFMTSGLVLNEDIKWISFHSGYDFGYLLKLLTNAPLPRACGSRRTAPHAARAPRARHATGAPSPLPRTPARTRARSRRARLYRPAEDLRPRHLRRQVPDVEHRQPQGRPQQAGRRPQGGARGAHAPGWQ
jgi:hypothetical protein